MYKKRFKAWGIFKNKRRKPDADSVPRRGSGSTEDGKSYDKACHGRPPSASDDVGAKPHGSPVPKSTRYLRVIGPREGEDAFVSIANWVNANFDRPQGYWANFKPDVPSDSPRIYPSSSMYHDFALGSALWVRGEGKLAGLAVRKAFLRLEDVFRSGDPGIVRNLLDIFFDMMRLEQAQLIKILRGYLASIAARELTANHPLARLFRYLMQDEVDLAFTFKQIWRCFVTNFHIRMGSQHIWLYEQWAWDSSFQVIDTDPEADRERVREALQTLALNTQFIEAMKSTRSHMELLKSTGLLNNKQSFKLSAPRGGYAQSYAKKSIVWDAIDQREWDVVEREMKADIRSLEARHGSTSPRVVRELWSLEKVLRKVGRFEKADAIGSHNDFVDICGPMGGVFIGREE
jgi:hypothetical protein